MALQEYLLKKVVDLAFQRISEPLRASGGGLRVSPEAIEKAITFHLRGLKNWAAEISFADLRAAKNTVDAHVPLDVFLQPRRLRTTTEQELGLRPLEEVITESTADHLILLGQPGAGKTTSMKWLCWRILHDDSFLADSINVPF